jgi:hypothetical protein
MRLSFIQLTAFRVNWKRLGLTDADMRALEIAILENPAGPPIMSGTGGLRKIRFSGESSASGKSGGARVCYVYFRQFELVYFCAVFPKNEKANLSKEEKNAYRQLMIQFEQYLARYFEKGWTP